MGLHNEVNVLNQWMPVTEEDLEMMLDLLDVETAEPLPQTDPVRDLKAIGNLIDVDVEAL